MRAVWLVRMCRAVQQPVEKKLEEKAASYIPCKKWNRATYLMVNHFHSV